MRYKYGCDMRGMLSFQIMWLLSKKQMHGEQIAKEIEKRRGDKPKAGTLYPALRDLKEAKLITGRKSGRTITYSLTRQGKDSLKHAVMYFCRSFGDVIAETN